MKMVALLGAGMFVMCALGLLFNEFVFSWGRNGTLFLVTGALIGFVMLLAAMRCLRRA